MKTSFIAALGVCLLFGFAVADDKPEVQNVGNVDADLGADKETLRTDDKITQKGKDSMKLDELSAAQMEELQKNATSFQFQTEVNRMMKLIINSLYQQKDIFLRELISNASDALDKIRLLALTIRNALESNPQLEIRIKADKENKILSITDSGVGMTKQELIANLGTIAKSGTAEFLGKMQDANTQEMNDMIGQFGVGFYSAFLVAKRVVVTTKHNDDKQYIWDSDSNSYSIADDPRGDTLKRGTTVTLHMKDEAVDFLEEDQIRQLIKKYSQFINFPIYMWGSKTVQVEEEEEEEVKADEEDTKKEDEEEEDGKVEEEDEEKIKKKKTINKTVWDWELLNEAKPIWTQKPSDVSDEEYNNFYKTLTKDSQEPLAKIHFTAEGEVTFKSLLYIPKVQAGDTFNRYGTKTDNIKLYVRRVFITDKFNDIMPNYLSFIRGIIDSDDLPLNVSREDLQQHKLIKIIKKKLIRKVLDMIKKLSKEDFEKFWKEYSTNIKLGVMEDTQNRARLMKLLKFHSSTQEDNTFLADYVERMKTNQKYIYYIAGASKDEVRKSPFVERLNEKGYEVLYLTEPVDEYTISSLPEFEGKKFQNVAKEGFTLDDSKKSKGKMEKVKKTFEPLISWLNDILKDHISKAQVSERLTNSPCALVAGMFGWTGNMERLSLSNAHQKADDPQKSYYLNQKKTLEINPRHALIRELLRRVEYDSNDEVAKNMATLMLNTATLRSGYMLRETSSFADNVEQLMRNTLGIPLEDDFEIEEEEEEETKNEEKEIPVEDDEDEEDEKHDEL